MRRLGEYLSVCLIPDSAYALNVDRHIRSGYRMGGISTPLIAIWLVWLLLASVAMVKAPNFARLFKHPQEEANYDALEQEDLVERKGSSDDNSLPMDQFTIGE
jgi:hypothetical protein